MVRLLYRHRRLPLLAGEVLACRPQIPALACLSGCAHGCLDCPGIALADASQPDVVTVVSAALTKLRSELRYRDRRPAVVAVGAAGDLFQPLPEVLDLAYDLLHTLFRLQIGVLLWTKGTIPPRHLQLLGDHAPLVQASIIVSTLDARLLRVLEPQAPAAEQRLTQIPSLLAAGVATTARIEPIVPGLNASEELWRPLLQSLQAAGIRQATARVLRLRPTTRGVLLERLAAGAEALPAATREVREVLLRRLQVLGWEQGIEVQACACGQRDDRHGCCLPLGDGWPHSPPRLRQLPLFAGMPEVTT